MYIIHTFGFSVTLPTAVVAGAGVSRGDVPCKNEDLGGGARSGGGLRGSAGGSQSTSGSARPSGSPACSLDSAGPRESALSSDEELVSACCTFTSTCRSLFTGGTLVINI